jgi:hypothetical protein
MQRLVVQEEKAATHIIAGELHKLFHDAASITGMTYRCKLTGHTYLVSTANTSDWLGCMTVVM